MVFVFHDDKGNLLVGFRGISTYWYSRVKLETILNKNK